jgi:hypothetical protein
LILPDIGIQASEVDDALPIQGGCKSYINFMLPLILVPSIYTIDNPNHLFSVNYSLPGVPMY